MKRAFKIFIFIIVIAFGLQLACKKATGLVENLESEWLSGGIQTAYDESNEAFTHAFVNMNAIQNRVHEIGDEQFDATFVTAPAKLNPGLGPVFNNVSCVSCHISDGRGKVPGFNESAASMLFRLSLPGADVHGGPKPVPGFGDQLQPRSILNVTPEGDVAVTYTIKNFQFADGTSYSLRVPDYKFINLYTQMPSGVLISPRVAPVVFGLGLLGAISDDDILKRADPNDKDNDGIRGTPNYVWDFTKKATVLGRFGWKANQPSLLQQAAAAYVSDMGITNMIFPIETTFGQPQYTPPVDNEYELSDELLYSVEFYLRTLQVPKRRNLKDPAVLQGKKLFAEAGCIKCHVSEMRTKVDVSFPAISNQIIHPYTDLLLHDMGEGLADNRPDYNANGKQWRTPPLWGIGLTEKVNGHTNFLHDGRARNLLEAVMWHGGEAEKAKNKVANFSKADRNALVTFLESL